MERDTLEGSGAFLADILVVDDALANLQLLFGMLKDEGYRVRPVPSGRLALQAAKARPPDVVLLDVNMPEMNGYEVCRQMKLDDALRPVPVIFISALSEAFDKVQAFSVGGVDFVTKPFHLEEVRARIETHLALLRMQRCLGVQNEELERTHERLREVEAARKLLVSAVVHDLKNPLAAVMANAEYLLGIEDASSEVREVAAEMLASARGVHRDVENLLHVARRDEVALVPDRRLVPIVDALSRARATAQALARVTGHDLVVDVDPKGEAFVDADLFTRVLENLLDNALKYAPRGTPVRVSASADERGSLTVRVEDAGPGIPERERARIFEPYVRLDRDRGVEPRTSQGLGLAFCRLAVEAHGGRIWVEEGAPRGAAFCITIPGPPSRAPATGVAVG